VEQVNIIKNWVWVGAGCLRCWSLDTHRGRPSADGRRRAAATGHDPIANIHGSPRAVWEIGMAGTWGNSFPFGFYSEVIATVCPVSRLASGAGVCARTVGSELVM